jgi:hypothetical protein
MIPMDWSTLGHRLVDGVKVFLIAIVVGCLALFVAIGLLLYSEELTPVGATVTLGVLLLCVAVALLLRKFDFVLIGRPRPGAWLGILAVIGVVIIGIPTIIDVVSTTTEVDIENLTAAKVEHDLQAGLQPKELQVGGKLQLRIASNSYRSVPLRPGAMAFNAPERMRVGDDTDVEAVVGIGMPSTQLLHYLNEMRRLLSSADRKVEQTDLGVGTYMIATLSGYGFQIDRPDPWEQRVDPVSATKWRWSVRALEAGTRKLELRFEAKFYPGTSDRAMYITTLTREIYVEVAPQDQKPQPPQPPKPPAEAGQDHINPPPTVVVAVVVPGTQPSPPSPPLLRYWQVLFFVIGCLGIILVLVLVWYFPNPTATQEFVFRTILALSVGIFFSILPEGLLNIHTLGIKASAGGAGFLAVFYKSPAWLSRS